MDARPGGSGPSADSAEDDSAEDDSAENDSAEGGSQPTPPSVPDGLDAVEAELGRLTDLPIAAHVDVFAAIHRQLTEALSVTGPASQPGGATVRAVQTSGSSRSPAPGAPHPFPRGR